MAHCFSATCCVVVSIKGHPTLGGADDGIDDCPENCLTCQLTCNATWVCKPNERRNQYAAYIKRNMQKGPGRTETNPLAALLNSAAGKAMQKFAGAMTKGGPVSQAALQGMAREMAPAGLLAGASGPRAEGSMQHRPMLPTTSMSREDRRRRSQGECSSWGAEARGAVCDLTSPPRGSNPSVKSAVRPRPHCRDPTCMHVCPLESCSSALCGVESKMVAAYDSSHYGMGDAASVTCSACGSRATASTRATT